GKNGADDTRLNLSLTYRIGEPLAHQLDSSKVGAQRSLAANRLELVNRNNDVVLEYRKQTLITLQLPPDVYGAELRQAGGKIISNTGNQITLQLPAWSSDRQSVTLSGRARDTRGNLSDIARTRILVSPAVQQQLAVSTDKTTATADGTDSVRYTLTVTGSDGKPVSGQAVRWEHNGGTLNGENTTNADGVATATLTSQTAGIIRVAATTRNQTAKAADFDEYCRIAKSTRDVEMNQAIRLLDICFPLPVKLKLLREHTVTCEKDADITVSTAHRSKGLEWPVVILDEDFADITDPLMPEDERRDETNLLYVAVTRARKTLVLSSLMRQLAEEAGRDEQSQKATETSPSENGENDAVYGQEGENA
ncbi:ATP-binding domain-containing protein, partial [Escherichia coli]